MSAACEHGVGERCDNADAVGRRDFTVEDIDRLCSEYGYGGERHYMGSAQASVDGSVVKAANASQLTECELAEWLCSKLGRWYAEDSGWFWKPAAATREHGAHRPTALQKLAAARTSMENMRWQIREGKWF